MSFFSVRSLSACAFFASALINNSVLQGRVSLLSLVNTCSLSLTDQINRQLSLLAVNNYCSSAESTMSVMPPMCAACSTFLVVFLISIGYAYNTTDPLLTLSPDASIGLVEVMTTPRFLLASTFDTLVGSWMPVLSFFSRSDVDSS